MALELIIENKYTPKELSDGGLELRRFYSSFSLYNDEKQMYFFRHDTMGPKSKPIFTLKDILQFPENREVYTQYLAENEDTEILDQCINKLNKPI